MAIAIVSTLYSGPSRDPTRDLARTFRYRQRRAPLVSEDVETDAAVAVDVWVIDAGGEVDLWRLEGVVCGKMDGEEEDTARVWRVAL